MASAMDLSDFENDPRLFLFTSLTAGSSHIITATSRLETILKANKIPFQAIDTATDEKARRLWQRRAQKKKLPGLVKDGFVLGDLEEVEEWNEFEELKENIGPVSESYTGAPGGGRQGVNIRPLEEGSPPAAASENINPNTGTHPAAGETASALVDESSRVALPGAWEMAERNKMKSPLSEAPAVESITSAPAEKEQSINAAKEISKHHPSLDHLSAPGSRIQSGTATPAKTEPAADASEPANEMLPEGASVMTAERRHRGSEVREVPLDQIKKWEDEMSLKEEEGEEGEEDDAEKTQKQDAKEPGDAPKSVGD